MKLTGFHIAFGVTIGILLIVLFVGKKEQFDNDEKAYCSTTNSCTKKACDLNPGLPSKCDINRTTQASFFTNDRDWGELLGGKTIPICTTMAGSPIESGDCASCGACGSILPPTKNEKKRICVPLSPTGCLRFDAPKALQDYLNKNPSALSCCGSSQDTTSTVSV